MTDLKEFLIFCLKSPALYVVLMGLFNTNIKWLFPSIPDEVVASFNNFVTVLAGLVVAYLGGKYVEGQGQKRKLAKQLALKAPLSALQQLNEVKTNE